MDWFIVVYFLINSSWIEADKINKEGWSPIVQPTYNVCVEKINESNERFRKIADYRKTELDIKFECECRKSNINTNIINCKDRNWFQKIYDKLFLIK